MNYKINKCESENYTSVMEIWNEAIDEGKTLPWINHYTYRDIEVILPKQVAAYCAIVDDEVVGFYILHPNSIGRNDHIGNALYIVKNSYRGKGIGTELVKHSLIQAKEAGFLAIQYNAVVASNYSVKIYNKLGFEIIGRIKNGFRLSSNEFDDLLILYYNLEELDIKSYGT